MNDPIIGIDLGTSNSAAAVIGDDGQPRVLADARGGTIQPSVVSFHPNGSVLVGAAAKQRRIIDAPNTVFSSKRLIGRTFGSREVTTAVRRMPYAIKQGTNEQPVIATRAGELAIPEIAAIVLDHMRSIASEALGTEVGRAVITVPANFTDAQRSATASAGAIAGITVVRIINEPTAAALAYGHRRRASETIAVYDFGGGTFDVTLLRLDGEVYEVLSTAGDTFLGGDDIDERLVEMMAKAFLERHRVDLRGDAIAMQRMRAVAEQTKIRLSSAATAPVRIDEIAYATGGAPLGLEHEIRRDELLARIGDLIDATFPVCRNALDLAGLKTDQIDEVVLVGGTTKMPHVRDRVAEFFGRPPRTDVHPDEAVALGAAIQAEAMRRALGSPPRTTARSASVAPPPPLPSRRRPPPTPPPPPAAAVARRLAPGPRQTARRAAATAERAAQPPPIDRPVGEPAAAAVPDADRPPLPAPEPRVTAPQAFDAATPPAGAQEPAPWETDLPAGDEDFESAATDLRRRPDSVPASDFGEDTEVATAIRGTAGPPAGAAATAEPAPAPDRPVAPTHAAPPINAALAALAPPAIGDHFGRTDRLQALVADAEVSVGPTVLDIVPQALAIATVAGYCEQIIPRNSQVPCARSRSFAPSHDFQDAVRIRVCLGDSRRFDDNAPLGEVTLSELPPRRRAETNIAVTFEVDANGMLNVAARDEATGDEQKVTLTVVGTQSDDQIEAAKARFRALRGGR